MSANAIPSAGDSSEKNRRALAVVEAILVGAPRVTVGLHVRPR